MSFIKKPFRLVCHSAIAGLCLSLFLLAGCGQKGPLKLPEDDQPGKADASSATAD